MQPGINIFSGEKGLGGALTNPTEIAYRKRKIVNQYPVVVFGVNFISAEAAYQGLKKLGQHEYNDWLMVRIIAVKLKTHARLYEEIKKRGGTEWIQRCSHFTYAKSASFQAWEGQGMQSRFIRNLSAAYELVDSGQYNECEFAPTV